MSKLAQLLCYFSQIKKNSSFLNPHNIFLKIPHNITKSCLNISLVIWVGAEFSGYREKG
jgi:hypothetical protein